MAFDCLRKSTARDTLSITDNRTGVFYDVAIEQNSIRAADFKQGKSTNLNGVASFHHKKKYG